MFPGMLNRYLVFTPPSRRSSRSIKDAVPRGTAAGGDCTGAIGAALVAQIAHAPKQQAVFHFSALRVSDASASSAISLCLALISSATQLACFPFAAFPLPISVLCALCSVPLLLLQNVCAADFNLVPVSTRVRLPRGQRVTCFCIVANGWCDAENYAKSCHRRSSRKSNR